MKDLNEIFEERNRAFRIIYDTVIEVENKKETEQYNLLCENLRKICNAEFTALATFNNKNNSITINAVSTNNPERHKGFNRLIGQQTVLENKQLEYYKTTDITEIRNKSCLLQSFIKQHEFGREKYTGNNCIKSNCYSISSVKNKDLQVVGVVQLPEGNKLIMKDLIKTYLNLVGLIIQRIKTIEELIETNKELKKSKEKAEESDKLKSAFLANMSHEIRTPLNGLLGFAELLANPDTDQEDRECYSEVVLKNGNQLLNIINDIIDISIIEAGQVKVYENLININNLLDEIYSSFQLSIKESRINLILTKELDNNNCIIKTDEQKLKQIINNLLSNSLKYTHEGFIEFGYNVQDNCLKFFVKDTGIGIPEDKLEIIFDRFRQANNSSKKLYGGTGLGLSITKSYVELLGGNIRAESRENSGSVFSFTLPYKKRCSLRANHDKKDNKKKEIDWSGHSILIAEDEDSNYLYLKVILSPTRAKLVRANNGKEAIETILSNSDIDVILMDLKMSEVNGYEATKQIKKLKPELPIIAQTAFAFSHEKELAFKYGFDEYIVKPIHRNELLTLISKYID